MTGPPAISGATLRLLSAWWGIALGALGLSTAMAVVLVAARTPFLGLGAEFFRTALVLHVDLAVVVWFLAAEVGIWTVMAPVQGHALMALVRGSAKLAAAGVALALLSPWLGRGTPILANYVPVIDTPAFLLALTAFGLAVCLAAAAALASGLLRRRQRWPGREEWGWAGNGALLSLVAAGAVFVMAQIQGGGEGWSFDDGVWGLGHVLQNVHVLMLMAAWLVLGQTCLRPDGRDRWLVLGSLGITVLATFADLGIALAFPAGSTAYRRGFTEVMRWFSWPGAFALAGLLLSGLRRQTRERKLDFADWGLMASMALFFLGAGVGATIRSESTAIPAHYHGTVGAVTLAYMLWGRKWAPCFGLDLPDRGLWRWQPFIYALGTMLLVTGLAWSGFLGVPRKAPHAELAAEGIGYWVAMGIAGVGGCLAMTGAGIFVSCLGKALGRRRSIGCSSQSLSRIQQ